MSQTQKKEEIAHWEEMTRLQEARWKNNFFELSPKDTDCFVVISEASEKLEKMCGSFNAAKAQNMKETHIKNSLTIKLKKRNMSGRVHKTSL